MKLKELTILLINASVQSAEKAFAATGILRDHLSKTQAYQLYGRSNVDRWLSENLIKISNKKIDRLKLEAIAASSNRITYLPVADRLVKPLA
jgi:hypothetical protein